MRTLVLETATAACSVALIEAGTVVAQAHEITGRGHAERLVPMIAALPAGGRAERILVDVGPGSFTGIRVGIAAARGLALGWGAVVQGYSSLSLIAAAALATDPSEALAVVLEGGHGEVFMQGFRAPLMPTGPFVSLRPDAALAALDGRRAIGSGIRFLTALDPRPIYGRAPDAKPLAS